DRLLLSGLSDQSRRLPGVRLWERATGKVTELCPDGTGPVAFTRGTDPCWLTPGPPGILLLHDLARGKVLRKVRLPVPEGGAVPQLPGVALTPDGAFFAAAAHVPGGGDFVAAWEAASGDLLGCFKHPAGVVAVSPDGKLLACGGADGWIGLWSLTRGQLLAGFRADRTTVYCLAFGRDPYRRKVRQGREEEANWLLAAGD